MIHREDVLHTIDLHPEPGRGRGPTRVRSRSHHHRLEYTDAGSELDPHLHLVRLGPLARQPYTVDRQAIATRATVPAAQHQAEWSPCTETVEIPTGKQSDQFATQTWLPRRHVNVSRDWRVASSPHWDRPCVSSRRLCLFDRQARLSQPSRPIDGDGVSDRAWRRGLLCRADRRIPKSRSGPVFESAVNAGEDPTRVALSVRRHRLFDRCVRRSFAESFRFCFHVMGPNDPRPISIAMFHVKPVVLRSVSEGPPNLPFLHPRTAHRSDRKSPMGRTNPSFHVKQIRTTCARCRRVTSSLPSQ
mgnify:CR=1 FL=1